MKRLFIIPFVLFALPLFAAPIGERQARAIATKFFATETTRANSSLLKMEWAGSNINIAKGGITKQSFGSAESKESALLYIYNRLDGDGFVVVAGDDNIENPIIAFSHNRTFVSENIPDGARAILDGWCRQIAAARADKSIVATSSAYNTNGGKVVCAYETALWGQGAPFNNESPVHSGVRVPCGCVATASGIICHYFQWPERGEGVTPEYTYTDDSGQVHTIAQNELGHPYDYSLLKRDYRASYTEREGAMVARLLFDIGAAFRMRFSDDGSGAVSSAAPLITHFGFSSSAVMESHSKYTEKEWTDKLQQNIFEYGPTYFSGRTDTSGHAFVLDGYTDNGYFSINYGWGGMANGYYLLPKIDFYLNQKAIFCLEPKMQEASDKRVYLSLHSSSEEYHGIHTDAIEYRVGESCYAWLSVINRGLFADGGEFCVAHCDREGKIKSVLNRVTCDTYPNTPSGSAKYKLKITLTEEIEDGDCLRVFYRVTTSDEWVRALRDTDSTCDEVPLRVAPSDVARSLKIAYEKESKAFTFTSLHAIHYSVTGESAAVVTSGKVASHTPTTINLSEFTPGRYTFSFASGAEPYKLVVVL